MKNAFFENNFMILENKYFLTNTRYYNIDYLLYPYYDMRYHLKDQALASWKLSNKEKLFNFYYSSLQNVIERIFDIIKYQFQILETSPKFIMLV